MARCVAAAELGCTIEEKRILADQTVGEKSAQIGKSYSVFGNHELNSGGACHADATWLAKM